MAKFKFDSQGRVLLPTRDADRGLLTAILQLGNWHAADIRKALALKPGAEMPGELLAGVAALKQSWTIKEIKKAIQTIERWRDPPNGNGRPKADSGGDFNLWCLVQKQTLRDPNIYCTETELKRARKEGRAPQPNMRLLLKTLFKRSAKADGYRKPTIEIRVGLDGAITYTNANAFAKAYARARKAKAPDWDLKLSQALKLPVLPRRQA